MIRACPHCGTRNRIPAAHLADSGHCGNCKKTIPALATPLDVDADLFREIIRDAAVPVLVDFWAPWCGPCKMAAPEVAKVAGALIGQAIVLKLDTEAEQALAAEYAIRSIPYFAVFVEGQIRWQQAGLMQAPQLEQAVRTVA